MFVLAVSLSCVFSLENPSNPWMWSVLFVYVQQRNDPSMLQAWLNMSAVQFSNCAHGGERPKQEAHMMCMTTLPSHAKVTTCTSPTRSPIPLEPGPLIPQPRVSIPGCCALAFVKPSIKSLSKVLTFHPPKSPYLNTAKTDTKKFLSLNTVASLDNNHNHLMHINFFLHNLRGGLTGRNKGK